ncbi:DUF4861 domain-containing protein [Seonamhaeicola algicola]|uniref:DUF4861 domain-containing protein n=1 Tax=Seonamhaeicola algicola TaxID=1719036 RepID=A0A5C7AEC3_9FLAO|nr:DUF4861 family protein [Seonamhaeicola algicola]TXE06284.1 DUF4861 domain-containing protein [Seonamhaeicola algicola]
MKALKVLTVASILSMFFSCEKDNNTTFQVENTLDIDRSFETIELSKSVLNLQNLEGLAIKNIENNNVVTSQLVDTDADGVNDLLLFQPKIKAKQTNTYKIVKATKNDSAAVICYSRFVPERTDDYAWENNKVAFRIFGPNAQYRFENNLPEPTLSSGVDAWLKKVEYPIINKWYKKYTEKTGSYHEDTGEGLDNFHVGKSRGVGGLAYKKDSIYYISKNFIKHKTITTGPIRTSFYVEYDLWGPEGTPIKESRIISLDYGNNLSKFEVNIQGIDTISAGLTLHENDGVVTSKNGETWLNYWQPHANAELGTALVAPSIYYAGNEKYETDKKDLSNAFIHLKAVNNSVVYYAGFTWSKSNQFKNQQAWEQYLSAFAIKVENPLKVKLINN